MWTILFELYDRVYLITYGQGGGTGEGGGKINRRKKHRLPSQEYVYGEKIVLGLRFTTYASPE